MLDLLHRRAVTRGEAGQQGVQGRRVQRVRRVEVPQHGRGRGVEVVHLVRP
jgi:hypothetical protein